MTWAEFCLKKRFSCLFLKVHSKITYNNTTFKRLFYKKSPRIDEWHRLVVQLSQTDDEHAVYFSQYF